MWLRVVLGLLQAARANRLARGIAAPLLLMPGLASHTAHAEEVTAAPSQAVVVTPLSLINAGSLDFGQVLSPVGAGTVVLTPTSTPICTATGGIIHSGACNAAVFWGLGSHNQVVRLRFPNGRTATLTNQADPTRTMAVTNLTFDGSPSLTYVNGNLASNGFVRHRIADATGIFSFRVGGTLNVARGQVAGRYVGSFVVTIDYQQEGPGSDWLKCCVNRNLTSSCQKPFNRGSLSGT